MSAFTGTRSLISVGRLPCRATVPQVLLHHNTSKAANHRSKVAALPHDDVAPQSSDSSSRSKADREDALLLAYYASQNQSLFAAQCFVETVLDAYTCGDNVDQLQTALQLKNMQQDGALLQPQDLDLLLSWIILIMLTAKEVGVPDAAAAAAAAAATAAPASAQATQEQQDSTGQQQSQQQQPDSSGSSMGAVPAADAAAAGITQAFSRQVLGLLQFVKQAAKLYFEEGYSVQRLQSLQATVAADPSQGQSQFLQMMQQYTRLVLISLEVAACCQLPTQRELTNPTSLDAPSGYTTAFGTTLPPYWKQASSSSSSGSSTSSSGMVTAAALAAKRGGLRAHAVKLMTAFVGAVIGSPYSLRAFVLGALEAYEAGVPAAVLHSQLAEREFAQSGGLVPALPQPEVLVDVNKTLFGRWLSLVYMSAAQLNAVFPGAADQPGWAWYGGEDEVQANAMAGFVGLTLVRLQEEAAAAVAAQQGQQGPEEDAALDTAKPREDPLMAQLKSSPESAEKLEIFSKQLQQELQEQGTLRGKEVPVMVKMPDPDLETTSGAVRVWRQQVELVQAVFQYMNTLYAEGGMG